MTTETIIIKARLEEIPTIGQFTIDSYIRDFADFKAYKTAKYTPAFLTALQAKAVAVNAIVNPVVLTGELKVITLRLTNSILGLRSTMNLLEGYVVDAVGLTVGVKDFGISGVRKKVASGDAEGLNAALNTLLTNVTNNLAALNTAGYPVGDETLLADVKQSIFDDNAAQNVKENKRAALVVANIGLINDFLADIKAIWGDGKRLYKFSNKTKLKDYTNSTIIKRIRNDELHTLIVGKVLNKLGIGEADAKIKARPSIAGKRGKTVKSGKDFKYELKGLRPTTYLITVTLVSGESFAVNGDAVTNKTIPLDLQQPM